MALSSEKPVIASEMRRERSPLSRKLDTGFVWLTGVFAISLAVILLTIAIQVGYRALPAMQEFGLGFLVTQRWDPVNDIYGALPQIYGTLVSSFIGLILALPIGLGVAIFLSEDFLPTKIQRPIVFLVELLAAIPSVVYGLWGIFVLIPILRNMGVALNGGLSWIPLFSSAPTGPGMYVAGVILAIMILPIIAAISRDALVAVPDTLRQAAYGLSATRWETILKIIMPAAFSGIVGGTMLALGRAMGETMAVTMVIGNANKIKPSLFDQGSTISSLLANQFAEADGLQISSLMYAAFVLFLITLIVNVLAELIVRRIRTKV
ncbi:phosphate ABC transporter permease subunit PstC [filamentous cyanobacterium LEGE 11480]|uniref:Phosphate transport system permease protein n=1 Tax=Romeriopsis navalis LEGE 11480 TaxID=2777977 RepID=A0A928VL64_9CYAN|nr:phosphate ABC transporter permease subunit PstC [Romeriopsis navalis]MBE9030628.1 phosphate ABC transporter permease subunit PstC [Romeriopsis navalis LEGE 11480]